MVDDAKAPSIVPRPGVIADRYQISGALGQGGMARVYRVTDSVTGRELALKQLLASAVERQHALLSLFEAEFHTLAQLSHPRVIEVYDYGVDEAGAFYTMELLDGGDLRDRSPMPFREACSLIYDVCSSLALLHSRRLVHRDISPRNVRCTRDGHAKLIDFGTMVPMGHTGLVAGTPAFVAPEVLHHALLDGRADLFSLGATLYYALTRRTPFAARELRDLAAAWERKPQPPSTFNPEIPPALDTLTLALLSLDPAMRPRLAFEVMERLAAIAGLEREESVDVSRAYLSTPLLVGREDAMAELTSAIERAHDGRGSGRVLRAETGLGRSRLLDACALEAKAHGAVVLRASATGSSSEAFAVVQTLADQLIEALGGAVQRSARTQPAQEALFEAVIDSAHQDTKRSRTRTRFKRFSVSFAGGHDPTEALIQLLLQLSQRRLIVIGVDDLHRCDIQSASLLAALAARIERRRLLLVLTVESGAAENAPDAMRVVAGRCAELQLPPLSRAQTEALLSSVFGAVPNLSVLTEAIHEVAAGNPGACVDLTQHLVENGVLRYAGGGWTLPERIDPAALPGSAQEAIRGRLAALSPLARGLAEAHALSPLESYSRNDYRALRPDADHQSVDHALLQLISQQVLASDGSHYALSRQSWATALTAQLDSEGRRRQHGALARLYEDKPGLAVVHHLLEAGQLDRGLDRLLAALTGLHDAYDVMRMARMGAVDLLAMLDRAHAAAIELGRPAREGIVFEGWMVGLSIFADDTYYYRFAPRWRAQLEHDSGLTLFRELGDIADPGQRLMRALQSVSERFAATPEHERGYPPQEAIRLLVLYVGVSIAMGSRACDRPLLASLPGLLAPFAALSPIIEAIRLNSIASCNVSCDSLLEQGRAIWLDVYARLMQISPTELPAVLTFRHAIAYAIGLVEARIGFESATSWAELLDKDPAQHVSAIYLRKVTRLHHGDFEGAEQFRQQAELAALEASVRPMFTNVVAAELWAHAAAGDLTGVKQALDRIEALAARYPGWQGSLALGQAQFQLLRGDLEAAKLAFERCLAFCAPDAHDPDRTTIAWPSCIGSYLETLDRLGLHDQARRVALDAIAVCREHGIGLSSHEIVRGLALAEARLGDHPSAWARLEGVIEEQTRLGVKGLQLGASYEACARIAIWTGDERRLQHYARLTALEYRYGSGSQLGARYERLMEEARQAGAGVLPELTDFASTAFAPTRARTRDAMMDEVLESMISASDQQQRAQRGLRLLCKGRGAKGGHLYLLTEGDIVLAASEGGHKPPAGLREFLQRYLHFEREDCEGATAIATEQQLNSAMPMTSWSDAQGNEHHPLVLSAELDGIVRQIGVASFVSDGATTRRQNEAQLGAAIAAHLVGAGDVPTVMRSKP